MPDPELYAQHEVGRKKQHVMRNKVTDIYWSVKSYKSISKVLGLQRTVSKTHRCTDGENIEQFTPFDLTIAD